MGFSFFIQSFILSLTIILCLILFFTASPSLASSETNLTTTKPSVYDVIQSFNFPIGILPKGVQGYDLETSTGKFSAYFSGSCSFSLEGSYELKYKPTINGIITKGKLTSLQGVSVKLFFFWVDIIEVQRIGDNLGFSVGIAGADFPIDNFEESPQCGCGLKCNDGVQDKEEVDSPGQVLSPEQSRTSMECRLYECLGSDLAGSNGFMVYSAQYSFIWLSKSST